MNDERSPGTVKIVVTEDRVQKLIVEGAKQSERSRIIRQCLRLFIVSSFILLFPLGYLDRFHPVFGIIGALLLVSIVPAGVVLTLMGGLAPSYVRDVMTDQERQRLDN